MEQPPTSSSEPGVPPQAEHPIFALGRKLNELFVQQYDRISLHNDEEENGYRRDENRFSSLMMDKTLSDDEHVQHANAILALADRYEGSAIHSLNKLNASIDRHLAVFEETLETLSELLADGDSDVTGVLHGLKRYLVLSKELHASRLAAAKTIVTRVECDRFLPNIIIRNHGDVSIGLSADEVTGFQETLAEVAATLKQSHDDNTRIEAVRVPLSQQLFVEANVSDSTPPNETPPPEANAVKPIHPLEGKAWFRLVKVLYICLWCLVVGICLLIAATDTNSAAGVLIAGVVMAIVLILARKGFYYVTLGRTTVSEKPGTGYLDWDELNASFEQLKITNPDMYQREVQPLLASWKQQYGRRVPIQAYQLFKKRVDAELERLSAEKQRIISAAASKGSTIEISALRENMEKTKAEYQGGDRAAYVRGIDAWIMKLEASYGTSIPIEDASRLHDELDQKFREQAK